MPDKPENPPAFPMFFGPNDKGNVPGMSLRDYFAGKAMLEAMKYEGPDITAKKAYQFADAMLDARLKGDNAE